MATVSIGNLSPDVTDADLRSTFEPFGRVRSIRLLARRRMAFVEFKQPGEADAAIEALRGTQLKGRTMDVALERSSGGRPRFRGRRR